MAENIVSEVEDRLTDLFGASDNDAPDAEVTTEAESVPDFDDVRSDIEDAPTLEEEHADLEESPLKDLKSIVLSIDWEISDEIMSRFLDQVNGLMKVYQDDRIIQMFLKLLNSVGRYIKAKKENSDADVVKLLNSAYAGLEKAVLTKEITEDEKKKLIIAEVNKFKKIRERLEGKPAAGTGKAVTTCEKEKADQPEPEVAVEEAVTQPEPEVTVEEAVSQPEPEVAIEEDVRQPVVDPVFEEAASQPETEPQVEEVVSQPGQEKVTEEIPAAISAAKSRGIGLGSKVNLFVLLPLVIIVAAGYAYLRQLTGIHLQIDQMIQTYSGVSIEDAGHIVLAVFCGLVVLIGLFASVYVSRLAGKVRYLTGVVENINAGGSISEVKITSGDEIGALAKAIGRLRKP